MPEIIIISMKININVYKYVKVGVRLIILMQTTP